MEKIKPGDLICWMGNRNDRGKFIEYNEDDDGDDDDDGIYCKVWWFNATLPATHSVKYIFKYIPMDCPEYLRISQ